MLNSTYGWIIRGTLAATSSILICWSSLTNSAPAKKVINARAIALADTDQDVGRAKA